MTLALATSRFPVGGSFLCPCSMGQETTKADAVTEADVNPKAYLLADAHLTKKLLDLFSSHGTTSSFGKEPMKPLKLSTETSLSSSRWLQTLSAWRSSCTFHHCARIRMCPTCLCTPAPSRP